VTERERKGEEEREKEADPINSRKIADPSFMLLSQRFVGQTNALIDLRFYSYVSARVEKRISYEERIRSMKENSRWE